ncbi:hypothetical protein BDD14_6539 [Edaphobacter modestus]|uniref:Uncharacterized protein n=1 Tax=Edaphobacter modestus TaxID=388466 RepID=A0A4Q7XZH8_9BACT|nr:hypothetical protein BDD14_6539 [Edaphobacter modestus]
MALGTSLGRQQIRPSRTRQPQLRVQTVVLPTNHSAVGINIEERPLIEQLRNSRTYYRGLSDAKNEYDFRLVMDYSVTDEINSTSYDQLDRFQLD